VEVGVGEQRADEGYVGDRRVVHGDGDLTANIGPITDIDRGAGQGAVRGPNGMRGIWIDAGGARRFARCVHDAHLVTDNQRDLQDREEREHEQRQQQREFDRRLPTLLAIGEGASAASGSPAPSAGEPVTPDHPGSTLLMTLSNSAVIE
jgi:hypothetical protein